MLIQTEWKDIKGEEKLTSGPNSKVLKVEKKKGLILSFTIYLFLSYFTEMSMNLTLTH